MDNSDNTSKPTAANGPTISRRTVLVGGALAAASAVAYARQPEIAAPPVEPDTFKEWIPTKFDGWEMISSSGVVLPPPDSLSDRLYDNLATRVYGKSEMPGMMVLMAYNNAQDGVLQVHRPEVCYPVGGYQLTETEPLPLQAGGREVPANFFTASSPNRTEQVLYFTRLGNAYPRSWFEQRMAVIEANLAGDIPDGMLMRFSMLSTDRDEALDAMMKFADRFVSAASPELQKLLVA